MTCTNWTLTILSIAIFIFAVWPDIVGAGTAKWIVAIAAIIVLLLSWTGVKCKFCEDRKTQTKKR